MEQIGVKIVSLKNGLELLGKVFEDNNNYKIKKGCILVPAGQGQLGLAEWLPYAKTEDGVTLKKDDVLYIVEPNDEVANQYSSAFGSGVVIPTMTPDLKLT
jgi:hypothetical protein